MVLIQLPNGDYVDAESIESITLREGELGVDFTRVTTKAGSTSTMDGDERDEVRRLIDEATKFPPPDPASK